MTVPAEWQSVMDEINAGRQARETMDSRYLVQGYLLVTPEQYRSLRGAADQKAISDMQPMPPVPSFGIPVLVIYPDRMPLDLGDGWMAVNRSGAIYAFDSKKVFSGFTSTFSG